MASVSREILILLKARDQASSKFGKVEKSSKQMNKVLIAGAGAVAAAFSASKIQQMLSQMIDNLDNVGKGAKRLGITAEEFQKLAFAANRSGASIDDIEKAFKRMSSTVFDAERNVKESKDALESLGLTVDDLKGKKPEEQFKIIATALNEIEDASTKAALAQDVFGRSGTNLIPMIGDMEQLREEIEKIGVVANEDVEAAESFKDSIEDLTTSLRKLVTDSGIIQFLADIAKGINEISKLDAFDFDDSTTDRAAPGAFEMFKERKRVRKRQFELRQKELREQRREEAAAAKKEEEEAKKLAAAKLKEEESFQKKLQAFAEKAERAQAAEARQRLKTLEDMNRRVKLQKLLNEGKEREVFIAREVATAESTAKLTAEERKQIMEGAGALFDLQQTGGDGAPTAPLLPASATVSRFLQGGGGRDALRAQEDTAKFTKSINEEAVKTNELLAEIEGTIEKSSLNLGVF